MADLEICKRIWGRIYRPHSAVPDVEVGYVLEVLVDALVEGWDHPGTPEERWALACVAILGKASFEDICLSWSDKTPRYLDGVLDGDGCAKEREFDDYEQDMRTHRIAMRQTLHDLLSRGDLREVDDEHGKVLVLRPPVEGQVL